MALLKADDVQKTLESAVSQINTILTRIIGRLDKLEAAKPVVKTVKKVTK